jgi:hypothetical protein
MSNIIKFPENERTKNLKKNKTFSFHKERLDKLMQEVMYEIFRLYQEPDFEDEDIHYQHILTTHSGQNKRLVLSAEDYRVSSRPTTNFDPTK